MMTPELCRILRPKTTIARMVSQHIINSVAITAVFNAALAEYGETLTRYWGGHNPSENQTSHQPLKKGNTHE